MPRSRSPDRKRAKELYLEDPTRSSKSIAEEVGRSEGTVRGWKNKDNWDGKVTEPKERNVPKKVTERSKQETTDASSKRSGNPEPVKQFTERNQAAKKHGLFSRYMPADTLAIIDELNEKSPKDLLWDQIQIQYAAIIRAQKIMHVEDAADHLELTVRETAMSNEYQTISASERHATFLSAQSRAITELRTSINHYNKIADEDEERALKLDKLRAEIKKLEGPKEGEGIKDWKAQVIEAAKRRKEQRQ